MLVCFGLLHLVSPIRSAPAQCLTINNRIPSGGITTFGPLIINSFGFDAFSTTLLNIPFGAVQIIATIGGAWLATRLKRKGPVLILLCIPPIAGVAMLLAIPHTAKERAALLTGYYLVSMLLKPVFVKVTDIIPIDLILSRNLTSHLLLVFSEHGRRNQEESHHSRAIHRSKCWKRMSPLIFSCHFSYLSYLPCHLI